MYKFKHVSCVPICTWGLQHETFLSCLVLVLFKILYLIVFFLFATDCKRDYSSPSKTEGNWKNQVYWYNWTSIGDLHLRPRSSATRHCWCNPVILPLWYKWFCFGRSTSLPKEQRCWCDQCFSTCNGASYREWPSRMAPSIKRTQGSSVYYNLIFFLWVDESLPDLCLGLFMVMLFGDRSYRTWFVRQTHTYIYASCMCFFLYFLLLDFLLRS